MDVRVALRVLLLSLLLLIPLGVYFVPNATAAFFGFWWFLAPLWLPVVLAAVFIPLWITYIRSHYVSSVPYILLELKPGEQTPKTARAMEVFFYSLHQRTTFTRAEELLGGMVRLPWSFEIAATKGTVRFFVYIPRSHRASFEVRLRSEFKDIDIDEPRDYTRELHFDPMSSKLTIREFALQKPDPYPIRTYEAYEGKKDSTDPFSQLLQTLVEIPEQQYVFISLIIRPHQRERKRFWEREVDALHSDASAEIGKIIGVAGDPRQLPKTEQDTIAAIEAALKKPSFDCGLRVLYTAPRSHYDETRGQTLDSLFDAFADPTLNAFTVYDPKKNITWPLSDIFSAVPWLYELHALNLFRRRAYFFPPYYGKPFVLNSAELATLFHLPPVSRSSPLARSRGARLEPPDNLPV